MTVTEASTATRVEKIIDDWGRVGNGVPTDEVWQAVIRCPADQALSLVNFFKMRDRAAYPSGHAGDDLDITGREAFQRYADVSMPSLEKVGGRFLLVAPFGKTFIGAAEDWDLVAIGTYPNPSALLALFELGIYRDAYIHRIAACSDQRVSLCLG